jgi:hypothetical protein
MRYNCLEYLIKWKGYDTGHNSWEVHRQVHTRSKITTFHCNHPSKAQHISAATFYLIPFTRADLATSWRSSHVVTPCLWRRGDVRGHPVLRYVYHIFLY